MFHIKILSKHILTRFVLLLSGILLSASLIMPTWAMEPKPEEPKHPLAKGKPESKFSKSKFESQPDSNSKSKSIFSLVSGAISEKDNSKKEGHKGKPKKNPLNNPPPPESPRELKPKPDSLKVSKAKPDSPRELKPKPDSLKVSKAKPDSPRELKPKSGSLKMPKAEPESPKPNSERTELRQRAASLTESKHKPPEVGPTKSRSGSVRAAFKRLTTESEPLEPKSRPDSPRVASKSSPKLESSPPSQETEIKPQTFTRWIASPHQLQNIYNPLQSMRYGSLNIDITHRSEREGGLEIPEGLCISFQKVMHVHPFITELKISNLNLSASLNSLAIALHSRKLKILILNECKINYNEEAAKDLFTTIGTLFVLEKLGLGNNEINDEGLQALAANIKDKKTLKRLYLNHNKITDLGIAIFLQTLESSFNLKVLRLGYNGLTDVAIQEFAQSSAFMSLESLDLSGNKITDKGAKIIADILRINSLLQKLKLAANEITGVGAESLGEMLKDNVGLTNVSLAKNRIDEAGTLIFLSCLIPRPDRPSNLIINLNSNTFAPECRFFITEDPENCTQLHERALALFPKDDQLYCKFSNKPPMRLCCANNSERALYGELFERTLKTLKGEKLPGQQEDDVCKLAFETITDDDKASLLRYISSTGYLPLVDGFTKSKNALISSLESKRIYISFSPESLRLTPLILEDLF